MTGRTADTYPPCPAGCGHRLCWMERRDLDTCPVCGHPVPVTLQVDNQWRSIVDRDQLLFDAIMARPNGDIVNIMQAARELPGSAYDRLSMAYREITGTDGDPDGMISLRGSED